MKDQKKLLIVEDEAPLRELLFNLLEDLGVELYSSENIQDAYEKIKAHDLSLVLSDITMPGGTGLDLLAKVRAEGNDLPFVFLSAHDSKENMQKAMRLGAIDFVSKPFDTDELKGTILKNIEIAQKKKNLSNVINFTDSLAAKQKQIGRLQADRVKSKQKKP